MAIERQGRIGDEVIAALGEAGLFGLSVPAAYGGQGLSQTGYCRVSEEFGRIDATTCRPAPNASRTAPGASTARSAGSATATKTWWSASPAARSTANVPLILTPDMAGVESPFRYDTMGLRGNDLRHLTFRDVRVPPENVLGEPGQGFLIAMNVLNNGRMSLGTGSVGRSRP